MNIGVPSRFACLKIEDDDNRPQSAKSKEMKKKPEVKTVGSKQLIGIPTTTSKRKKNTNSEQWEEWKIKDSEIVNGTYEQDLQNAIMLSKLDYEHNKEVYKKNQATNGKAPNLTQNKKKKSKVMSINEFLNSGTEKQNSSIPDLKEEHFFDDIKSATKVELNREQIIEKRKEQEANIDQIISLAQCQEKLEEERAKRFALQIELDKARAEIVAVKERNKTLCGILGHGEMKDKADVLVELEKLYSEKNELSEEVSRLHVLLEQERSKVVASATETHNNKHKDKVRFNDVVK
ncbi:hypothetical protein FQR65_LT05059 [Abscondita terminalis]|nr:hypothetical protein FQR65_LT05059 [Abscondita terminalis]